METKDQSQDGRGRRAAGLACMRLGGRRQVIEVVNQLPEAARIAAIE